MYRFRRSWASPGRLPIASFERRPSRPPVSRMTPSEWWDKSAGSSLGSLRSAALAVVKSREMLEYPARVFASSVRREPSVSVSSPPMMGRMSRLFASRANSSAPQRLVSVRASAGYPCSFACASSSCAWDAPAPKE